MFNLVLGTGGYQWSCTIGGCRAGDKAANASDAASDAILHRDADHPEMVWSHARQEAATRLIAWLSTVPGGEDLAVSPTAVMRVVNDVADALGLHRPTVSPSPASAVQDWGRDQMTTENMHDPRLINAASSAVPRRHWTTNHQVRWQVGDAIQMPPEGKGCKTAGARVGEDQELCALPGHNAANIQHVFAIGEQVTRIAHN